MKKQTDTYILYGVISVPPADCLARDVCECMWVLTCLQCVRTPIPVMCVALCGMVAIAMSCFLL